MIKKKVLKDYFNQVVEDRGIHPYDAQIGKGALEYMNELVKIYLDNLINFCLDHIEDHNKKYSYKQKKRVTQQLITSALYENPSRFLEMLVQNGEVNKQQEKLLSQVLINRVIPPSERNTPKNEDSGSQGRVNEPEDR